MFDHEKLRVMVIPETYVSEIVACIARKLYSIPQADIERYIYSLLDVSLSPSDSEKFPEVVEVVSKSESESTVTRTPIDVQAKQYIERENARREVTQRRYIQNLIKRTAESMGFKAVIEEPINNSEGRIEVALMQDDFKMAVEISVTNTIANEVQNIIKCLDAGYNPVVMCSDIPRHLANIKERVSSEIDSMRLEQIMFMSPIELFAYLDKYIVLKAINKEQIIRGYRVIVRFKSE